MEYCKVKKLIHKDINNISFALSNPNEFDLSDTYANISIASKRAKILSATMKSNIEYVVKIGNTLTNLWIEAEKDLEISTNAVLYGKNKYLAAILLYFSAKNNSILVTNNIKTSKNCNGVSSYFNLLEHRVEKINSEPVSKNNSYKLSFDYKVDCKGYLMKTIWISNYEFLQPDNVHLEFINAAKSSFVRSLLVSLKE
tara:strand:+ start:158 stop:751 length:594 start_codon:yes stop_codon:yes gene_type:complete